MIGRSDVDFLVVGQSFGRFEGSIGPISLIFRSLASSCINSNEYNLRFFQKQFNDSSLWSSSVGVVVVVDRFVDRLVVRQRGCSFAAFVVGINTKERY